MATRVYAFRPGGQITTTTSDIIEGVGAAATSAFKINLTVDLATNLVNDGSSTRGIKKDEVLKALEAFQVYILKGNWPPA